MYDNVLTRVQNKVPSKSIIRLNSDNDRNSDRNTLVINYMWQIYFIHVHFWFYYLSIDIPECMDMEHVQSISLFESCYARAVQSNTIIAEA